MQYSLSNTASLVSLKDELGMTHKYPNIYKPKLKIDGLKEQTLSLVTMDEPHKVTQGVWGILPQNYEGEWKKFQKIKRTLHVEANVIPNNILFKESLQQRRCLIIVTGFYMYHLSGNELDIFLVEKEIAKPFYLAGVYNVLDDGFVTCSVINVAANNLLNSSNNLYEVMPLEIPRMLKNVWLDRNTTKEKLDYIISKPYLSKLKAQRIAS